MTEHATPNNHLWCVYDVSNDIIIETGTFIEMEDLLDISEPGVIVTTIDAVEDRRQRAMPPIIYPGPLADETE